MQGRNERLEFPGSQGVMLAARLDRPPGRATAVALFAHCFTCSKESRAATYITRALTRKDIAVLRFDFTGLGSSEGDFANTNFSSNVDDLVAAADYLREKFEAPKLLVGHSLGGAAVLAAARRIPESKAVASIAAPFDPAHVTRYLRDKLAEIEEKGEAEIALGGRHVRLRRQFIEDIGKQPLTDAIANLGRALLILHSPTDALVGIENASAIFQAARHPKSFISLDNADHLLGKEADGLYAGSVLAAWASRYIAEPQPAAAAAQHDKQHDNEPRRVSVSEGEELYAQDIEAGHHRLRADEPVVAGGGDTGPTPYDLLLSALGACTSMTVRMYADRKGWPLEHVDVRLSHRKIHAEECKTCETKEGKIDRIDRVIALTGPLDMEQRTRLKEIADRCPVHRTLTSEVLIETRLAEEDVGGRLEAPA